MREVPWKKSTLRMRRPALGVAAAVRVIVAGAAITELEGAVSDTDTAQAEFVNTTAHKARPKPRLRRRLGFGLALCAVVLTNSAWAVSVSLTAPSNSVIAAPATITLTAAATPSAGRRILRVDFFQGTSRIGTDTSAPYGVTWSSVPRGTYILMATAIDSGGSIAVSNRVIIRVDTPP